MAVDVKSIKIGDYIETDDGVIAKVLGVWKNIYNLTRFETMNGVVAFWQVEKAAKRLIDLVEIGTIVNDKPVTEIKGSKKREYIILMDGTQIKNSDIKTMLTTHKLKKDSYIVDVRPMDKEAQND